MANDGPNQVSQITSPAQEAPKQHVLLGDFTKALSGDRLGAYSSETDDRDSTDAVARYLWNGALCVAFQPILHALEVTLRNTIYIHSEPHVKCKGPWNSTFPCWLTAKPTLLFDREQKHVDDAFERLYEKYPNPRDHTAGRLIARLGFGFWTGLLHAPYDSGRAGGPKLWPVLLGKVFHYAPAPMRSRQAIANAFDDVRDFRNRIAHHEPIWDRDPNRVYMSCYGLLGCMYPDIARAIRLLGDFQSVNRAGASGYRAIAAKLLGV